MQLSGLVGSDRHSRLSALIDEVEKGKLSTALLEVEKSATLAVQQSLAADPRLFTDQVAVSEP